MQSISTSIPVCRSLTSLNCGVAVFKQVTNDFSRDNTSNKIVADIFISDQLNNFNLSF